jgi:ABC-type microcin C transport system duplicated ATPase subunit YejF
LWTGRSGLDGQDLLKLPLEEMYRIAAGRIAMIFQEPMSSLNPVFPIGMQVMEAILAHEHVSQEEARERTIELLRQVGIPDAERRLTDYPAPVPAACASVS